MKKSGIADWAMENQNPWTGRIEQSLSPHFQGIRPVCAVCETYVNRFTDSYDSDRRLYLFRFECHGREEIVPIDELTVEDSSGYIYRVLSNYRPFTKEAEDMRQKPIMGYTPDGTPIVFASSGKLVPIQQPPDRPSSDCLKFMEKIASDMAKNIGLPPDALFADYYPQYVSVDVQREALAFSLPKQSPAPKSEPQSKPEDFLIPARKPRVITLEN